MPAKKRTGETATRLPAQPTRLLGRESDLEAIQSVLWREEVRLLTLTGPAGVGKTRLAIEVGSRMSEDFAQGVVFVDLSQIGEPSQVPATLARGVGLQDGESPRLQERLFAYLRERQSLLIVLDNFEQVLPAARWIADLLATCPGITLLVTSREPLHIRWEHTYRVPSLALADPDHLPSIEELARVPAVALFLERARAMDAGFALSEENARAVAELCVRLDGLPRAIELAAARTGTLALRTILDRLEDPLSVLRRGPQDLPERQHTLRSAIGWSYDLLDDQEQGVFRRLGVFVGGFTMDGAQAVAATAGKERGYPSASEEVLDSLASLVDKSLVQVEGRGVEDVRYRLLESMREYALEQLRLQGEFEEAHRAHALYFLELAERAEPELIGHEQRAWFLRLEQEHDNLSAALRWLLSWGEHALALRLAAALGHLWIRGHMAEGRRYLEDLVGREPAEGSGLPTQAQALCALGILRLYQGEKERSRSVLEESLAAARSANDPRIVTLSLIYLGIHGHLSGRTEESTPLLEEALVCSREAGDAWGTARALHELGEAALYAQDYAWAGELLEEARAEYASVGDERIMAEVLLLLAIVVRERGNVMGAVDLVRQAIGISRRLQDRRLLNMCMNPAIWLLGEASAPRQVALLIGINDVLHQITGFSRSVWKSSLYGQLVATVGARPSEEELATARKEAHAMSLEQMADSALEALDRAAGAGARGAKPKGVSGHNTLSAREMEVLRLVAAGLSDREIAGQLFITERTVRYHITSIFAKLDAENRAQAVALAGRKNLL